MKLNHTQRDLVLALMHGLSGPCPACGQSNRIQSRFCSGCGTSLAGFQSGVLEGIEKVLESYAKQFYAGSVADLPLENIGMMVKLALGNLRQMQSGLPLGESSTVEPPSAVTGSAKGVTAEEQLFAKFHKKHPHVSEGDFKRTLRTLKERPKCPMCGGLMLSMGAGGRGKAFGQGNVFGAFAKTYRCEDCGYLA